MIPGTFDISNFLNDIDSIKGDKGNEVELILFKPNAL